jgi:DNA-binding beta-propeller fold protein YncE
VSSDEPDSPARLVPIARGSAAAGRPVPLGDNPYGIALDPNGRTAYVVNGAGAGADQLGPLGTITPVSLQSGTAGKPIEAGSDPQQIVIAPDGTSAWVLDADDDNGDPTGITPVNLVTASAGRTIHVPARELLVAGDGSTLYAMTSSSVVPIDAATGVVRAAIALGGARPAALALSPDGRALYVVGTPGSGSEAASGSSATLTAVSTVTGTARGPVALKGLAASGPYHLAVTPNGSTVVVLASGDGTSPSELVRVSAGPATASAPVAAGRGSDALVADPDGSFAYVLSPGSAYEGPPTAGGARKSRGSVIPVDLADGSVGAPITVGYGADVMAIGG